MASRHEGRRPPAAPRLRRVLRPARHRPPLFRRDRRQSRSCAAPTPVPASGYLTDTLAAEAAAFIRRRAGQPFFLYVPITATHSLQAKPRSGEPGLHPRSEAAADRGGAGVARRGCRDESSAELRATGVAERTAVVFLGDNGCASPAATGRCGAAKGHGGRAASGCRSSSLGLEWCRRWHDLWRAGDRPWICSPHSCAPQAACLPAVVDGIDLAALSAKEPAARPHDLLFWGGRAKGRTRKGEWKLVGSELLQPAPGYCRDHQRCRRNNPAVVADLRQARAAWLRTLRSRRCGRTAQELLTVGSRLALLRERRAAYIGGRTRPPEPRHCDLRPLPGRRGRRPAAHAARSSRTPMPARPR